MKLSVGSLAVFGGSPQFDEKLHVGRPNMGDRGRLFRHFSEILDRKWLTNSGPCVQELEARICSLLNVRHCIATCNATVALEVLTRALDLSGEVIVPAFTFVATAHALRWLGITPVFCDIDPRTHSLDPARVAELILPRTTAILGVHLWGKPAAIAELQSIATKQKLKLLFDSAHAFGCSHRGTMIGNFGEAEVFSFHATKFFNTGEGGAIVTNDSALAARIRLAHNFGFSGYDQVDCVGTNAKMSEFSAAIWLTNLESLQSFIETNKRNYHLYRQGLSGIPGVRVFEYAETERCNFQYVVLETDEAAGIMRDDLVKVLWAENVLARRYFFPGCHRMEPYRSEMHDVSRRLPVTERLAETVLTLPSGTAVAPEAVLAICKLVRFVVECAEEISSRLKERAAVCAVR